MATSPAPPDALITGQQLLLGQIKKSHRLFVIRFWVLIIFSIFAFCGIGYLFFVEDDNPLPTFFILELVPIIIMIRSFKENWIFLKWSGPYLRAIEASGKTSPILTGLTAYVNRLYQAAFLDTYFGRPKPDLTPTQFLEEIKRRDKIKFILIGVVILLIGIIAFLLTISGSIDLSQLFTLGSPLLGIVAIAVVMVVMLVFQTMWMRSLKRWAQVFIELDEWGRQLERVFLASQREGKGGA